MNTTHGYHIDGTHVRKGTVKKNCGGPAACPDCAEEATHEQTYQKNRKKLG